MIGSQYRMSEFTGGVLLAQLRKLDTIIGAVRGHARRVYEGLADLPDLQSTSPRGPEGDIGTGIWLGLPSPNQRDRFLAAMRAENVPATPVGRCARTAPTVCGAKADDASQLALVLEQARPVDALWRGVLPQNDRHPPPIRWNPARPEIHSP